MAKTKQQKEQIVQDLKDKLGRAKAVVFADYKGLSMKQLSDLRDKLRQQNAEFAVTKNTLLNLALPSSTFHLPTSSLQGPTAMLLSYDDQMTPIKILVKALQNAALGKVKMGFLGAESLDEAKILQLATLPSRDELRGQAVTVLAAPLQGMVGVLQASIRNLVYALSQVQKSKGGV